MELALLPITWAFPQKWMKRRSAKKSPMRSDGQRREGCGVCEIARNPASRWSSRFSQRREDTLKRELQPTKILHSVALRQRTAYRACVPRESIHRVARGRLATVRKSAERVVRLLIARSWFWGVE
jgi:hypothetical protein